MPPKGFYHIITEKETKNGLTLFSTDPSFPGVKDENEMIRCIRYITNNEEYNELLNSKNKKLAIENKMLKIAHSIASDDEGRKALRQKINSVIREIDKSMSLLND